MSRKQYSLCLVLIQAKEKDFTIIEINFKCIPIDNYDRLNISFSIFVERDHIDNRYIVRSHRLLLMVYSFVHSIHRKYHLIDYQ
jgi:hypothetical protein